MRQRVDDLQVLAAEQLGRSVVQYSRKFLANPVLEANPRLSQAFDEAMLCEEENIMQADGLSYRATMMQADGLSYTELFSAYATLQFETTQANAIVDEHLIRGRWGSDEVAGAGVPLKFPGELDVDWLCSELGHSVNDMDIVLWISAWQAFDKSEYMPDGRPPFVAEHVFKRSGTGELQVREEDEVLPGGTFQLGQHTIRGPTINLRADFVRYLREHWPARADQILDHLKCKYDERLTHGSMPLVWRETSDGGRPYTLPEKLRLLRALRRL